MKLIEITLGSLIMETHLRYHRIYLRLQWLEILSLSGALSLWVMDHLAGAISPMRRKSGVMVNPCAKMEKRHVLASLTAGLLVGNLEYFSILAQARRLAGQKMDHLSEYL